MNPSWEGDEERGLIRLTAVPGEPEFEQMIEAEVERGVPVTETGDVWDIQYRRCPECSVPLEVSKELYWDEDNAHVTERETGKRFCLHHTNGASAVVRVLQNELGAQVDDLLREISREYASDYYRLLSHRSSLVAELMKFPPRGWGRLAGLSHSSAGITLKLANAYCAPVVAGRVWGLAEVFERTRMRLRQVSESDGTMEIALEREA
jgi:hypothetical protein